MIPEISLQYNPFEDIVSKRLLRVNFPEFAGNVEREMDINADYRTSLERAFAQSLAYLDVLGHTSVAATATLEELRLRLAHPLTHEGIPAEDVLDALVSDTAGGIL